MLVWLFQVFSVLIPLREDYSDNNYIISFIKIDNRVEIIVNDSIVFNSGVINHNPNVKEFVGFDLSPVLTPEKDEVIVRLFNGYEPYHEGMEDVHWEIEYEMMKGDKVYDIMWNEADDNRIGQVFEEVYYL